MAAAVIRLREGMACASELGTAMDDRIEREKELARLGRLISIVIAGTMLLWMAAQWIGGAMSLPDEYVFLFDLFALAGFLWAIFVTRQLWRKRREIDKD